MENLLFDYIRYLQEKVNNAYHDKYIDEFQANLYKGYVKTLQVMNDLLIQNGLIQNTDAISVGNSKKISKYFNKEIIIQDFNQDKKDIVLTKLIYKYIMKLHGLYNKSFETDSLSGEIYAYFDVLEWLDIQIDLWGYKNIFKKIRISILAGEKANFKQ